MALIRGVARTTASVKRIDRGLSKIKKVFKSISLERPYVKAGVLANSKREDSNTLTNAKIAIFNEYGTSRAPARPFIKPAFEGGRDSYMLLLKTLVAKKVYSGSMDYAQALGVIGTKMAYDMKAYVTRGPQVPPPNAPSTLKRKLALNARRSIEKNFEQGEPRTLINTARMLGSITYAVVEAGVTTVKSFVKGHAGDR